MIKFSRKCTVQVQTRDLLTRITSNFGNMVSHWKDIKKSNKIHQIRFLTAAVTSLLTKNDQWCPEIRFSSPNSGSTCQNQFKFWLNDLPYENDRYVEEKLSNSGSGCRCDVITNSKIANLVPKCASQVQTRDLLARFTSSFGNIISHIKTTDTYKITRFGIWMSLWRHYWL